MCTAVGGCALMLVEWGGDQMMVEEVADKEFVCLCHASALLELPDKFDESVDTPDSFDAFCAVAASLDVNDYLQCNADMFMETAFLSV